VIAVICTMIAAAPLSDFISERVEGILGTWTPRPFSVRFLLRDLGSTVLLELRRALIKLAWLLPLFLVSLFVPVVGQVAYIVLGGYLLAKFLGMDYVDWSLARRGYTWRERFAFAKAHRSALLGFGTAVIIALLVPFGFIAVWPGAVAGGTILCTRLEPEDKRGSREG
jgi:CysZ protein